MNDLTMNQALRVSTDGTAGPYIMVQVSQLPEIRRLLDAAGIPYAVDKYAISFDGRPEVVVVDLGPDADAAAIQAILDNAG